jgi:hypothetical protein
MQFNKKVPFEQIIDQRSELRGIHEHAYCIPTPGIVTEQSPTTQYQQSPQERPQLLCHRPTAAKPRHSQQIGDSYLPWNHCTVEKHTEIFVSDKLLLRYYPFFLLHDQ